MPIRGRGPTVPRPGKPITVRREMTEAALLGLEALGGKTISQLAVEYQLKDKDVRDRLDLVQQIGLLEKFRDLLLKRLVPPALAVYEARVLGGDLEAARDILFGLGVLQKSANATLQLIPKDQTPIKSIDDYRSYRKKLLKEGPPKLGKAQLQ